MRKLLLSFLCLLGLTALAQAHAHLQGASPAVGATVARPPAEVVITLSEAVEPMFSSIQVTDGAGNRVDKGEVHLGPDQRQVLIAALRPLAPGEYKVKWQVTSVDTHRSQGSYSFIVAP